MNALALINTSSNANGIPDIVCKILLVAGVIALIVGLAQAIFGLGASSGPGARMGRYGALAVAVVILVIYAVFC